MGGAIFVLVIVLLFPLPFLKDFQCHLLVTFDDTDWTLKTCGNTNAAVVTTPGMHGSDYVQNESINED